MPPNDHAIARLERRNELRKAELKRSLDQLELAVKAKLPTAAVQESVERGPYTSVAVAFGIGCLIGYLV
jgi:ElaB/YqjD/DUF883 family membrane-anchored ribosome-binding protein